MGRRIGIALLALCVTACASVQPVSVSSSALSQLQLRARAGLYPPDWSVRGDSHAAALERLEAWSAHKGIVIAPAPISEKNLLGHTSFSPYTGWIVLINRDLSTNNRLYTLLHELGHVLGPHNLSEDASEVIAEMVSAQVCQRIGLDVWPQTTAYLAINTSVASQYATVARYGLQIDAIVDGLSRAIGPKK
jgi:hypothetical protein